VVALPPLWYWPQWSPPLIGGKRAREIRVP
jgi:hypothetical protein